MQLPGAPPEPASIPRRSAATIDADGSSASQETAESPRTARSDAAAPAPSAQARALAPARSAGSRADRCGGRRRGVYAFSSGCDFSQLPDESIGQNTFVYAADGSLLGSIPAEQNRQVVRLGEMSPWVPKATVAIEDRRFYAHSGVDAEGIVRALWADVSAGKVVQGGSTITQQLVRT